MIRRYQSGWSLRVPSPVQRPNGTTIKGTCAPTYSLHTGIRQRNHVPLLLPPMNGPSGTALQSNSGQGSSSSNSTSGNHSNISDPLLSSHLKSLKMQGENVLWAEVGANDNGQKGHDDPNNTGRAHDDEQDRHTSTGGGDDSGGTSFTTSLTVAPSGMRYPHYFDTYHIFSQLHRAGFTDDQAKVLMKCMRGLLTEELVRAKETYLSSAEMENEAYLFDAACSELRTEIQNNRKSQALLAQTETSALQRESLVLQRLFEEEIDYMKNDVSMELNERKNATKIDSRATELQIQELNNRITIAIQSDLRSEVEALRWQTTRRGLFTIGVVAALILTALSYRNETEQHLKSATAVTASTTGSRKPENVSETDVLYMS
ncbi:hypothetical protein POJ06DRAFT_251622 [Lipomyces tetrasporus]|uniref:Mitochondrial protein n=1 Tax=Lipomyces tetrasporus TaxID=54092 RepID=A0AAD7VUP1_9ASCO|nr:uncharacterized protein POJ06DRAFT_251622 [Lipomyces tetrasporus]KAJ8101470.1 hypothetical protein POJ06DRAFT_251622 [Lipomyces tetrasporus]